MASDQINTGYGGRPKGTAPQNAEPMPVTIKNLTNGLLIFPNFVGKNAIIHPNETKTFSVHPHTFKMMQREAVTPAPKIEIVASSGSVAEYEKQAAADRATALARIDAEQVAKRTAAAQPGGDQPKQSSGARGAAGDPGNPEPSIHADKYAALEDAPGKHPARDQARANEASKREAQGDGSDTGKGPNIAGAREARVRPIEQAPARQAPSKSKAKPANKGRR